MNNNECMRADILYVKNAFYLAEFNVNLIVRGV